jgi:hypothetical protein
MVTAGYNLLYATVQVWIKGCGNVAPAPRIETGAVGWYAATEDVIEAIEVSDIVADVITDVIIDVADGIIEDSEVIMDVSEML